MKNFHLPARTLIRRFHGKEDGAVTVAAALWLPFFVVLLMMVLDLSMIFYGQARAHEVAENANRSLSIGRYTTFEEAETAVRTALQPISPNASAVTTSEDFMIRTVVTLPTSDLATLGIFSSLTDLNVTAVAQMVREF